MHAMSLAFAKIPLGGHTACAYVATSGVNVSISILMRSSVNTIVPFEVLLLMCVVNCIVLIVAY